MVPPELDEDEEAYIAYFWDLSRDRRFTSAGPGPIPWSSCHQYALHLGLGRYEDLYDDFMVFIGGLDAEYLRLVAEEVKKETDRASRKRKSRN